jgi:hypothetical protein
MVMTTHGEKCLSCAYDQSCKQQEGVHARMYAETQQRIDKFMKDNPHANGVRKWLMRVLGV